MISDLHTHTTASDGRLAPAALVAAAHAAGIGLLAITDHDTLGGIAEAAVAARHAGIGLVAGVELSVTLTRTAPPRGHRLGGPVGSAAAAAPAPASGDVEVHLLALGVDVRDAALRDHLDAFQHVRRARAAEMVARLNDLGVPVTVAGVEARADGGAIGRPHVAAEIVAVGAAVDVPDAFERFLRDGGPAAAPKAPFPARDAIRMVHAAGGLVVAAHPAFLPSEDALDRLVAAGIDGIEVRHPSHGWASERFFVGEALRRGLCQTGGSDYHGHRAGDDERLGRFSVAADVLPTLRRIA